MSEATLEKPREERQAAAPFRSSLATKRAVAVNATCASAPRSRTCMPVSEEEWAALWPGLDSAGWRHETLRQSGSKIVNYYVPPGVTRGENTRCRKDYFDSRTQVHARVALCQSGRAYHRHVARGVARAAGARTRAQGGIKRWENVPADRRRAKSAARRGEKRPERRNGSGTSQPGDGVAGRRPAERLRAPVNSPRPVHQNRCVWCDCVC